MDVKQLFQRFRCLKAQCKPVKVLLNVEAPKSNGTDSTGSIAKDINTAESQT